MEIVKWLCSVVCCGAILAGLGFGLCWYLMVKENL